MYEPGSYDNTVVVKHGTSVADLIKEGQRCAVAGQFEKSAQWLQQAIEEEPDSFYAHFELGLLYHRWSSHEKALMYFNMAHQLNPKDCCTLNNLGVVYYGKKKYHNALNCFLKAIDLNGRYVDAIYGAGKSYYALKNYQEAQKYFSRCLVLEPRHPIAQDNLDALAAVSTQPKHACLKIGFVSIWFERGQAYVTRLIRDALAPAHNTYVLARTGGVYGQPMLETSGRWNVPNLTSYPEYRIQPDDLKDWIQTNKLDVIIFNEEYDWNLVRAAKSTGAVVMTYLDYYKEEWRSYMNLYDGVLCSTFRTFDLVKSFCNAFYMGWAVDGNLFKPQAVTNLCTFFHNAGWLGINYRKMTPAAIVAFDALSKVLQDITLFVHSQVGPEKLPPDVHAIVNKNSRITFHVETVPPPGLYHKGLIHLFPTKLEGLGLPLMEGLACGLPAITVDAPPMNEFIKDGYNGLLVNIGKKVTRNDDIAFPECLVDMNDLADKMRYLAVRPQLIRELGQNAIQSVNVELDLRKMQTRLEGILNYVYQQSE